MKVIAKQRSCVLKTKVVTKVSGVHCEKVSVFEVFPVRISTIWTEYGEILRISPFSILMRKNMDQKHSEYGHFLDSDKPVFSRVSVKL